MPTSWRSGTASVRFRKLCTRAPRISMQSGSVKVAGAADAGSVGAAMAGVAESVIVAPGERCDVFLLV